MFVEMHPHAAASVRPEARQFAGVFASTRLRRFVSLAAVVLPLLLQGAPAETPSPSLVHSVTRGSLRGILMPSHYLQLSSRATGVIEKFGADEGQRVEVGDLLVQLNSDVERAEVARAEAVLEATNAEWEHARKELDRRTALRRDSIGSEKEFEDAHYAHLLATARRKQAQADLDIATARYKERAIFSPIAGMLFKRSRAVGEAVERLETVVLVIDASKLVLVVYAGADLIGKFTENKSAQITVDTGPARGTQVAASVLYVDPVLDPESGTFRIRLQVEATEHVQPGISVTLQVPSEVN